MQLILVFLKRMIPIKKIHVSNNWSRSNFFRFSIINCYSCKSENRFSNFKSSYTSKTISLFSHFQQTSLTDQFIHNKYLLYNHYISHFDATIFDCIPHSINFIFNFIAYKMYSHIFASSSFSSTI